ncbi:MAG: maleylpyruvate isomerase family mycothiol-dependent enzyme [Actinomycetota bacterium]
MEIPPSPPADYPSLLAQDRAVLLALLEEAQPSDWSRPTPCPGWSVLDLIVHLVGDDLGVLSRDRDGFYATRPPEGTTEEGFVAFIDDLNDLWVRAGRRLSPRAATDLLEWTGAQLVDLYRDQDPSQVSARVTWASDHPIPKWMDHAREFTESWIHHQQIRQALGLASRLEPEPTGAALDAFYWAYPYRLSGVRRPPGTSAEVRIEGPVRRQWRFISSGSGWEEAEVGVGRAPTVGITMDTERAWRLLSNGLLPEDYPSADADEDPELATVLLRTRAIVGFPQ